MRKKTSNSTIAMLLQDDVSVVNRWLVDGEHYAQTWLEPLDPVFYSVSYR